MMRLYQITDTQTGEPVSEQFFTDLYLAKQKRRELNGPGKIRFIVSPGPDHKARKTCTKS